MLEKAGIHRAQERTVVSFALVSMQTIVQGNRLTMSRLTRISEAPVSEPREIPLLSSMILQGDSLYVLRRLPASCLQCIVTSPPYWGLRDYDISGQIGLENDLIQ
jgi:hypothetical protein